jgi:molecular chaperone GrpE
LPDDTSADPTSPERDEPSTETGMAEAPPSASAADILDQRARLAEDRLAEVVAAYRQLKVETEGHRERISRDLERRAQRKSDQLLIRFIEIVDNLERALEAAQQSGAHGSLIEGLILVRTQLVQILQDQGLSWIPVRGLPFDPECSEVVDMQELDDPANDQLVVREMQRGYRLNGRVVRHAQVVVGRYQAPGDSLLSAVSVVSDEPHLLESEAPTGPIEFPPPSPPPDEGEPSE